MDRHELERLRRSVAMAAPESKVSVVREELLELLTLAQQALAGEGTRAE